jgi:hypothetical protein
MDERKRSIRELEEKKRETLEKLLQLQENWGKTVLSRLDAANSDRFAGELGRYRQLLAAIALIRGNIRTLEEDTLRLRDMELALEERNNGVAATTGALKELYAGLGKTALQSDGALAVDPSLRAQAEGLAARIGSRQERLGELAGGKSAGIFSWLSGAAQGTLIRAGLSKSQADLYRIYGAAGEQCFAALERQGAGEEALLGDAPAQIRALRQELALREESRAAALDEWGALKESLGIGGNSRNFSPAKKIRDLEQRIEREQKQLANHCAAFGAYLCERYADSAREDPEESAWLEEDDRTALGKARELEEALAGHEAEREKLQASLQIDEERDAIDKMKTSILSHRRRIAADESAIKDLEKQIEKSNRRITELMKL